MTADANDTPPAPAGWRLRCTYAELPAEFYTRIGPTPVRAPRLVIFNRALAGELGLDAAALEGGEGAAIFAGNRLPPGATPIAQAYAGHQYGGFTNLGDGRAILLGEQAAPGGGLRDIQLKGSGPTPYSRRGDGRATLGPMLREYIAGEAMHALGIPTTRGLAVAATGEEVWRAEGPLPGAVLTRVAASHLRVGTFEWAGARRDEAGLRALAGYALRRHYPDRAGAENPALALLDAVVDRQASLIAQWMHAGFVHGVMNTDNMAISGETIDYGPCAFIDAYDPAAVFSSIDLHGRYAFGNQPRIAHWNLARLAEALLPLIHPVEAEAVRLATGALAEFAPRFEGRWLAGMRRKLGLFNEEPGDAALVNALLSWMHATRADYTHTFAALSRPATEDEAWRMDPGFVAWQADWQARLLRQPQSAGEAARLREASNPAVIPRNHLVEAALAAALGGDLAPTKRLLAVLAAPYDHGRHAPEFRAPPPAGMEGYRTFCGT